VQEKLNIDSMTNPILMKIGGSLLTDKTKVATPKMKNIKRIAKELHQARHKNGVKIVIGHGGGSFPHVVAKKYKTHEGIKNKNSCRGIALVQDAASRLNRIFVTELINVGECAVSIRASSCSIAKNGELQEWFIKPIQIMLKYNMLPVTYGDVVFDTKKGCTIISTEKIIRQLPKAIRPKRILIVGEVDGVYTGDPFKDKNIELIPVITPKNFRKIKKYLKGSRGADVTGGMLHKVQEMLTLAKKGFQIEIINGEKPGYLRRALAGEKGLGTIIKK
jgi:isopentenyl phosphate kinase